MNQDLYYLLNFLEDEFRSHPEVRVRPVFKSGVQKSVDLEQRYDPEASSLHSESGVRVMTKRREFFFPTQWISEPSRARLLRQVEEIRGSL